MEVDLIKFETSPDHVLTENPKLEFFCVK